ncbi:MAG: PilZ domain-containing protein [Sphingomonadales bacterium]|nr:PilZ domain-containing protein [Sphingomonadales bacterium]
MTLTYFTAKLAVQPAPLAQINPNFSYAEAALEDRCAPRTKLRIPASLRPSGFKGFSVIVKDLSMSGFAAEALTGMKAGTRVFITMPGLTALEAEIAWNDGTMIGCAFQNLLNEAVLDSILNRFSVVDEG